jgi:hypothetical protein
MRLHDVPKGVVTADRLSGSNPAVCDMLAGLWDKAA